jgi:uncharacterized protein (TIGR04255 family)
MDYPHLSSAPITEAIFDIRVKSRPNFQVSDFAVLKANLQEIFPKFEERRGGQVTFRFEPPGSGISPQPPNIQDLGLQGYFFKSEDEKLIAQFRVDGFTLNKLKPYSNWDELQPLVMDLWNRYVSIAEPVTITRCAVRYINHIIINQGQFDLDDYLRAAPPVPEELPQAIGDFLSRVTIVDSNEKIAASVTQVFKPNPSVQFPPIILDIDTFKNVDMHPSDAALWDIFSALRAFKNKIFFNFVTEKTIGQFK